MSNLNRYKLFCETDQKWEYVWLEEGNLPTQCPTNSSHVVDLDSIAIEEVRKSDVAKVNIESIPAFAAKTMPDGKKLFKRVVGIRHECEAGENTIIWTNPFSWVKFMAMEIIGGETGDFVSLYVLDTSTGTYSTVPNLTLNQFGFSANVSKDLYVQRSEFDADVYLGIQLKMVYYSATVKQIGFNFVMNEVKT